MDEFDLLDSRVAKLARARFNTPSEIQAKAIPLVLSGTDVLSIAPTGSGKMESAFLPVLSQLMKNLDAGNKDGIQLLYITPLRALNRDMLERMEYWAHLLGLSIGVRHGDTKQTERVKQREHPPQIMVTTPESVSTLLISPKIRDALKNVKWVVVDEIHELIDSKRGVQLSLSIERLRERVKQRKHAQNESGEKLDKSVVEALKKQTDKKTEEQTRAENQSFQLIGLSATVGDEEKAAGFLGGKTKVARVDLKRKIELKVEYPSEAKNPDLAQEWKLDSQTAARVERITELIEQSKSVLVFVNTRTMAEGLSALLFQIEEMKGKVGVHHGSLDRDSRIATEKEFKREAAHGETKKLKAIVCTSSLELGIDVGRIDLVVQYHSPRQVTRLLQRVGRSGHRRDLIPKGIVIGIAGGDTLEAAVLAKRAVEGKLEGIRVPKNSLDVLAQQVSGFVLDECTEPDSKVESKRVYECFKRAYYYHDLQYADFLSVCKQLSQQRLLSISDDHAWLAPARASKLYYYENLSTIRDLRKYFIKDAEKRKNVGMLDEDFVAEYLQKGVVFITRGIPWKVLSITDDEVVVEQAQDYTASVPDWIGEEIPVVFEVGQEFADLLNKAGRGLFGKWELIRDYYTDERAAMQVTEFAEKQRKFFLVEKGKMFVEESGKTLVLHTFAGNEANEALARAVAALLSARLGESVRTKASSYSIAFEFGKAYGVRPFCKLIESLKPTDIESVLVKAIPATAIFRSRFVDVAKRFGFIRRDADLKSISIKKIVESSFETPIWKEALAEVLTEKMDVERAKQVISWPIEAVSRPELSPLASEFVELYSSRELLAPVEPTSHLLEAFKKNLLSQRSRLVCNYCINTFPVFLKDAPASIKCPHCQSTQATLEEYRAIIKKSNAGEPLKREEAKQLQEARRVESLIAAYGNKALIALSTYGIGPEAAARVLSRLRDNEEEFYRDLLEQQKQFIANRKYWKA